MQLLGLWAIKDSLNEKHIGRVLSPSLPLSLCVYEGVGREGGRDDYISLSLSLLPMLVLVVQNICLKEKLKAG